MKLKNFDNFLDESIRDKMTPVNSEVIRKRINEIIENPTGTYKWDVLNILNNLMELKIYNSLNEEEIKKIGKIALMDKELMNHNATGRKDDILWFANFWGSGRFFINIEKGKIFDIGGDKSTNAADLLTNIL